MHYAFSESNVMFAVPMAGLESDAKPAAVGRVVPDARGAGNEARAQGLNNDLYVATTTTAQYVFHSVVSPAACLAPACPTPVTALQGVCCRACRR